MWELCLDLRDLQPMHHKSGQNLKKFACKASRPALLLSSLTATLRPNQTKVRRIELEMPDTQVPIEMQLENLRRQLLTCTVHAGIKCILGVFWA